jgi:small subunit ribosomal protein S6e
MEIKVNIGDSKTKKTYNKTLDENSVQPLLGKKIGETIKGEAIDLPGYEMQIVGGSDSSGFPMRKDVEGFARKKIFIAGGVGMRKQDRKGVKLRKTVAGNTIYEKTSQINLKVTKWGKEPIEKAPEPESTEGDGEAKAEE